MTLPLYILIGLSCSYTTSEQAISLSIRIEFFSSQRYCFFSLCRQMLWNYDWEFILINPIGKLDFRCRFRIWIMKKNRYFGVWEGIFISMSCFRCQFLPKFSLSLSLSLSLSTLTLKRHTEQNIYHAYLTSLTVPTSPLVIKLMVSRAVWTRYVNRACKNEWNSPCNPVYTVS